MLLIWGSEWVPQEFKPNLNYRIGSYGHMYTRLKEIKGNRNINCLFLGSSHSYRGFDIRIFQIRGISAFNLGSSAQTPIQTKLLLERYLDLLNPKLIIYEVYPGTFTSDGVESALDIIANDKNDFRSLKMALNLNNVKVYNTLLYAAIRQVFNRDAGFSEPRQKDADTYISGGFVERKMERSRHQSYPTNEWAFNKRQFEDFEKVLSLIKRKKVDYILVYAPIPPKLYRSYTNGPVFDSIMTGYGSYYNFNHLMSLDDSLYFYDSNHLNQRGVEVFNNKMIEILKKP